MPSFVLKDEIPYSVLFPTKSLFPIEPRILGSSCFVHDVCPHVTKLDPKSLKCVFLGYSRIQKGYRCYCPTLNKYLMSTDITFLKNIPFFPAFSTYPSQGNDDDLLVYTITSATCSPEVFPLIKPSILQVYSRQQDPPATCSAPVSSSLSDPNSRDHDLPIAFRKGKRQCTYPISSFVSYDHLSPSSFSFVASLDRVSIPKTVQEALSHPGWRNAMIEYMNVLDANGTQDLVNLQTGKKSIGCKQVFVVKVNSDGSVA